MSKPSGFNKRRRRIKKKKLPKLRREKSEETYERASRDPYTLFWKNSKALGRKEGMGKTLNGRLSKALMENNLKWRRNEGGETKNGEILY